MDDRILKLKKITSNDVDQKLDGQMELKTITPEIKNNSNVIQKLLQKQVDHEFSNERLYVAMSLWCAENGYTQTSKFFSDHAIEERSHAMLFINYMLKKKMKVLAPSLEAEKREYTNMREVLEDSVKREILTSKMVGEILTESIKTGDLAYTIAHEIMEEQIEEEQLFNSLLNLYENCNGSKIDFEMEIGNIKCNGKYKIGNL